MARRADAAVEDDGRRAANRRVGAGFSAVVAASAGLMAYRSGATVLEAGLVALAGLAVGAALLVVLVGR